MVVFDEMHDSPRFSAGRESRSIDRNGYVAWGDLPALFMEGFPAPPAVFGVYPGIGYLFCNTMEAAPFYPDGQANPDSYIYSSGVLNHGGGSYSQRARVTINYTTLDYDDNSGGGGGDPTSADFISKNTAVGCEFMTLQNSGLWWKTGSGNTDADFEAVTADGLSAHVIIPNLSHTLTVHRAATIPMSAMRNCIGRVCRDDFYGAKAYSLLYVGSQTRYGRNTLGQVSMSVDHMFSERRFQTEDSSYADWRHWYDPAKHKKFMQLWKGPTGDNNRTMLYQTKSAADFNDLFVV